MWGCTYTSQRIISLLLYISGSIFSSRQMNKERIVLKIVRMKMRVEKGLDCTWYCGSWGFLVIND